MSSHRSPWDSKRVTGLSGLQRFVGLPPPKVPLQDSTRMDFLKDQARHAEMAEVSRGPAHTEGSFSIGRSPLSPPFVADLLGMEDHLLVPPAEVHPREARKLPRGCLK